jgi:hypothetical protein
VREHLVRGGSLTVTVTCTLELRDLGLPGAPGSVSMRRAFTSLLDPYRGVR